MNQRMKVFGAATFALLLLAACGSTGGNIFGNNGSNTNHIRGTVDSVDTGSHLIYLTNAYSDNGSMLSSGSSRNSVRIAYDNNTTVNYQGRNYNPADLERGDQVDIYTNGSSNNLYASSITVTSDVRTSGSYPSGNYPNNNYPNNNYPNNGTYATTIHGTVRSIDVNRQTITVDPGYGSYVTIQYNSSTPVYYNGSTYQPGNLEIGDQIDIRGNQVNNNLFSAQDITVTRSMSSNTNGTYGTYPSSSTATLRGTVSYVNTSNHTIQLTQTNWMTGFDRSVGNNGSTITISYDPNVQVNVNGKMYAISGLQRGDVIDVNLQNQTAEGITLVHDVNSRY